MLDWFMKMTLPKQIGVVIAVLVVLFLVIFLPVWFTRKSKSGFMDIPGNSNPMDVFKVSSGFNSIVNDPSRSGFSYDMQVASEDSGYRVGPGDRDTSAMTDAALAAGQK